MLGSNGPHEGPSQNSVPHSTQVAGLLTLTAQAYLEAKNAIARGLNDIEQKNFYFNM